MREYQVDLLLLVAYHSKLTVVEAWLPTFAVKSSTTFAGVIFFWARLSRFGQLSPISEILEAKRVPTYLSL